MGTSEELREALLNLEEARIKEAQQKEMAEALLEGLRILVTTTDLEELFPKLFDVMKEPLGFDVALVLLAREDGSLVPLAGSEPRFMQARWESHKLFKRALGGSPASIFDTSEVPEWRILPEDIRQDTRSALIFPLTTSGRRALFICTHKEPAHFSRNHTRLARRFSVLASQAMLQLESASRLAEMEERLDAKARLAELNLKLAESERKLAKARKMEALGLLAGGVAHDLNNILSGLVGYPQLMLMEEDLSDDHRDMLETIDDAGRRASAVVADLLTVARGVASPKKVLNLNEIVRQHMRSPEHQQLVMDYPEIKFTTRLTSGLMNVLASQVHLRKILMNLLNNAAEAVRYNLEGRITIETNSVYLDRSIRGYEDIKAGEYVRLKIQDNGGGISEEDLERIFEPFYTRKVMGRSGTGLGLTIVWNAMQEHEGYIDVVPGDDGTSFKLYFPVCRERLSTERETVSIEQCMGSGQKILVVDDQPDQRKIACAYLRKLGYKAFAVSSGETAVDYIRETPVDLLLLDMIMDPGINGFETYRRVIEIRPGQRAVIASGYTQSEDVEAAQKLGAGRYIKKPYTLEILGQAVKEELDK